MTAKAETGRRADEIGRVERSPEIHGNQWRIAGTRIQTYIPWECFDEGESIEDILRNYPTLTRADVLAAIAFEQGRVAEREEPSLPYDHGDDLDELPGRSRRVVVEIWDATRVVVR
jgi:uncharacterized protein (DUF433 family)